MSSCIITNLCFYRLLHLFVAIYRFFLNKNETDTLLIDYNKYEIFTNYIFASTDIDNEFVVSLLITHFLYIFFDKFHVSDKHTPITSPIGIE